MEQSKDITEKIRIGIARFLRRLLLLSFRFFIEHSRAPIQSLVFKKNGFEEGSKVIPLKFIFKLKFKKLHKGGKKQVSPFIKNFPVALSIDWMHSGRTWIFFQRERENFEEGGKVKLCWISNWKSNFLWKLRIWTSLLFCSSIFLLVFGKNSEFLKCDGWLLPVVLWRSNIDAQLISLRSLKEKFRDFWRKI